MPPPVLPTEEPTTDPEPAAEPPVEAIPEIVPDVLIPGLPDVAAEDEVFQAWDPTDHPKEVLTIGVATFTMLTLIGPAGLALTSMAGMSSGAIIVASAAATAAAASESESKKGSVKAAKVKSSKFSAEGSGTGDQSLTRRTPGWEKTDAWGLALPIWLATRSPLG